MFRTAGFAATPGEDRVLQFVIEDDTLGAWTLVPGATALQILNDVRARPDHIFCQWLLAYGFRVLNVDTVGTITYEICPATNGIMDIPDNEKCCHFTWP